jgi:hypothetical protein
VQVQEMSGFGAGWSNDQHLWWTGAHLGDKLSVAIPVKEAGKYEVKLQLTKARDYGIVQLYLDGKKVGNLFDPYDPNVVPSGVKSLGNFDLTAGDHTLTAEITGANQSAVPSYMFGLDYVLLEPVK